MIVNNYMPLYGMQLAFKSFSYSKGIAGSKWIGFKNFKFLFATKDAFIMVRNTLLYNILWIFVGAVFGITVAILFNEIPVSYTHLDVYKRQFVWSHKKELTNMP